MKLPRDLSGRDLARRLGRLGYELRHRSAGSHMRLVHPATGGRPEHPLTIPDHDQIKVGTLARILADIEVAEGLTRDELMRRLFD